MNVRNSFSLIAALSGALLSVSLGPSFAMAQTNTPRNPSVRHSNAPRRGLPGRRISGGTRIPSDHCVAADAQPLVAMVPDSNLGLTAKASPTLWFSMPAVESTRQLEFSLFTQTHELVYQTRLTAPTQAGVVGIDLAALEQAPTLKVNESYRWSLAVVCGANARSEDLWVEGWVQRLEPTIALEADLASADPSEMARIYLEHGFWYEALTHVLTATAAPSDEAVWQADWSWLVQAAELDQVLVTPLSIVNSVHPIQEIAHWAP